MEHSKLERAFPLQQIPFPEEGEMTVIRVEPEEIATMVQKLREDHLSIEPAEGPSERGDYVVLEDPESGKTRLVNTGRPMSDEDLAEDCLGRRAGEEIRGCRIVRIKRRMLPPFDDALVRSAGVPEAGTPEEYRDYCLRTLQASKVKRQTKVMAGWLSREWLNRSQFRLETGDLENVRSELEAAIQEYVSLGQPREELEKEMAQMLWASEEKPSLEDCAQMLLRCVLLGRHCLEKYGIILGQEQYEKELAKIAQEQGGQPDDYRRNFPYSMFLRQRAAIQIDAEAQKYIKERCPFRYE